MSKQVWVITNPELGWDCVISVCTTQEDADAERYIEEDFDDNGDLLPGAEPCDMIFIHGPYDV
jgi:hypothetical protein